jgi:Meiotically up-regulated gene 113
MDYPVCRLWLILVEKYNTMQPFKKFSTEYSLDYNKVRMYGSNQFKKLDENFIGELCEILNCSFDELFEDDEKGYFEWRNRHRKMNDQRKKGVVYVVKNNYGQYKIGRSFRLAQRLQTLNSEYKENLTLIHTIETNDTVVLERSLHKVYKDKNIKGEWFRLTKEDVKNIMNI